MACAVCEGVPNAVGAAIARTWSRRCLTDGFRRHTLSSSVTAPTPHPVRHRHASRALVSSAGAPRIYCAALSSLGRARSRVKPARPFGTERGDASRLRLVGSTDDSAGALLEQARAAEVRGRSDLARELYEGALHRAVGPTDAPVVPVALLNSARLANSAGEPLVALDILEAGAGVCCGRWRRRGLRARGVPSRSHPVGGR